MDTPARRAASDTLKPRAPLAHELHGRPEQRLAEIAVVISALPRHQWASQLPRADARLGHGARRSAAAPCGRE
ncbi:hypothetical protein NKH18_17260 [Streptomyces sp. M10(2022)]